jgi:hypothetical protein
MQRLEEPGEMNGRRAKIARTESLFRDVNERIAETSERFDAEDAEFMCECGDPSCAERLEVPLAVYEDVRSEATTFLLNPDHVEPDVEKVVRERSGYAVVKKVDEAVARMVRQLNPRAEAS